MGDVSKKLLALRYIADNQEFVIETIKVSLRKRMATVPIVKYNFNYYINEVYSILIDIVLNSTNDTDDKYADAVDKGDMFKLVRKIISSIIHYTNSRLNFKKYTDVHKHRIDDYENVDWMVFYEMDDNNTKRCLADVKIIFDSIDDDKMYGDYTAKFLKAITLEKYLENKRMKELSLIYDIKIKRLEHYLYLLLKDIRNEAKNIFKDD